MASASLASDISLSKLQGAEAIYPFAFFNSGRAAILAQRVLRAAFRWTRPVVAFAGRGTHFRTRGRNDDSRLSAVVAL
jgi:hypothetical protein